jgi:hypothetical protein
MKPRPPQETNGQTLTRAAMEQEIAELFPEITHVKKAGEVIDAEVEASMPSWPRPRVVPQEAAEPYQSDFYRMLDKLNNINDIEEEDD